MPMMVTCKVCKHRAEFDEFAEGCPNEECIMSRRRGRANKNTKPPAIGNKHPVTCVCAACLELDAKRLEDELDKSWEEHNKAMKGETTMANIMVHMKEVEIIGPYDGLDETKAAYVTCPPAIMMTITPRSRRRK